MSELLRARMMVAGCVTALALAGCGGGGGGSSASIADQVPVGVPSPVGPVVPDPAPTPPSGAPLVSEKIATDGREWLNFRRAQVGLSTLAHSTVVDIAAQRHSLYQATNNTITHDQIVGRPGFTGADIPDRLTEAGYSFNKSASHAYGEVISATSNGLGQYMAEELITAVYHRFVIFEPIFKEIGTGAATTGSGYNYFTTDFTSNNGYGAGLPAGQIVVWPFGGQTSVPRNFFSDTESPDPVPDRNEVGYPISVHTNIDRAIQVSTFSVRPQGGADLAVRLLTSANDTHTKPPSAAIVPLAPLTANTVYEVSFSGSVGNIPVTRSWSFTTAR